MTKMYPWEIDWTWDYARDEIEWAYRRDEIEWA